MLNALGILTALAVFVDFSFGASVPGIAAKQDIAVASNHILGAIPQDNQLIISTNSIAPNSIVLNNSVVAGDVIIGPGGDPASVIEMKAGGVITGDVYAATSPMIFPDIVAPMLPAGNPFIFDSSGVAILNSSGVYNSSISIDAGQTLKVVGNQSISVTGNFLLRNSSRLIITAGSCLKIYIAGSMQADYGAIIVNETIALAPDTPTDAQIIAAAKDFYVYGESTCNSVIFQNSGNLYGYIYAPNALVDMKNSGDIFGAIAANNIDIRNSGNFYYVPEPATIGMLAVGGIFLQSRKKF